MGAQLALMVCFAAALLGPSTALSLEGQDAKSNVSPQVESPSAKTPSASSTSAKADAASRRARWNKLSKEEKAELLARHKRLEALSPKDRAELESRAKRVHREMAEIEASLTAEELAQLDKLGRKERRDALRKMVAERASVAAAMVRTRMTPRERKRIEAAKPEERAEMLRVLRKRELERLSGRLIELGQELGMSPAKLEELQALPHHDLRAAIIPRLRKRLEREVTENGLPESLPKERWERIQVQGDMGFLRGVERVRARHPDFGVPAKQWESRQRRRAAFADRLEDLVAPTDELRARFPGLKNGALRRRIMLDRRHRIESLIGRQFHLRPGTMKRLQALKPQDFEFAFTRAIKLIRGGGDVGAGLDHWLGNREGRRPARKR